MHHLPGKSTFLHESVAQKKHNHRIWGIRSNVLRVDELIVTVFVSLLYSEISYAGYVRASIGQ